jgi:Holliday junction resolvase RusA-like endonuclease
MDEVVLTLPMPPTTNNLFAGTGRKRVKTVKYAAWCNHAGWELLRQHPPRIKGPVSVLIEVSIAESNDTWDVFNREKATMDLLVTQGVIQGDNRPIVREGTMRWADVSGVRVTIRRCAA